MREMDMEAMAAIRAELAARLAAFERAAPPLHALKPAAVAITVTVEPEGLSFLLTRRSRGLRNHSGQWALPGGRQDEGETEIQAALRELDEELGLRLDPAAVLATLDDYQTRSGYAVTPIVVWGGVSPALTPNPAEVASVHRITLTELDQPGSPEFVTIAESDRPVVRMLIGGDKVHAPTAAMLYQFREAAMRGQTVRVAELEQPVWAWR